MAAFIAICGSCFGFAGERIRTEAAHLTAYADTIENLETQAQNLRDAMRSLEHRIIDAANNQGATLVDPVVERLLRKMCFLSDEASKIIMDEARASDSTCLMGLHPNLWACYQTSKSAQKTIGEATWLLEMVKSLDIPVAYVDYSFLGVTPIKEFEGFESRVLVSNQIVAALNDPKVNKVGVYGMGGTGKTTLVEKIGAELHQNGTFSYVVFATVCEKQNRSDNNYQADLLNIQKQIAMGFKIQLLGQTLSDRAAELVKKLLKKDEVLIILDDIWYGFDLKDVGIPINNVHNKFKILMTSRSEAVLSKMNSKSNFRLDLLPISEARNLFNKMVGGDFQYSNWPLTAEQVIHRCGGIPIKLVAIARELRNEVSETWEDVLTQLKQVDGEDTIEMSYKFLENEEIKKLFLLCAQLDHRSIAIKDLVKYAMGLNMFKGCKKLKEVSGKLHKYLRDLKGSCLLQDSDEEGIIKMQDDVHKFASLVAFRDYNVFSVVNCGELEEWPSKEQLEHFSAISLPFFHLPRNHMLPAVFDNPKLESFLMLRSEIDASFQIPENFFVGMKGLKLMHLTWMSLSSILVSSFGALVELQTLCLDHCKLSDISVIGELPMLQALSLVGSSIVLVPKEMGKLGSTLKLLDLRDCCELETIAYGVISRLTLLEDLRIGASFMRWERLEGREKSSDSADETYETEVASLEEFKNLLNLIHLEICILDHAKMFPKDLVFNKLETFKIYIENHCFTGNDYMLTKTLEISELSTTVEFDSEETKALMDLKGFLVLRHLPIGSFDLKVLNVRKCGLLNDLLSSSLARNLWSLEEIKVHECKSMKSIIVSQESENEEEMQIEFTHQLRVLELVDLPYLVSFCSFNEMEGLPYPTHLFNKKIVFPKLEVLRMSMIKVEKIWDEESAISAGGTCWLQNLTTLSVNGCNNLRYLFTSSMVKSLAQLKQLEVADCESIEEIVESTERDIQLSLPKLDTLKLECLPNLQRFSQANVFECLLLRKLVIQSCSKLKTLVAFCNIEELEINDSGSFKTIWGNQLRPNSLSRLKMLKIEECLEDVVTPNLIDE